MNTCIMLVCYTINSSIYMYYPEIKQKAIDLRKDGYSYNYIIKHVPVTKSTLSEWLHDIPFTPNKHTLETIGKARIASGLYHHKMRVKSLEKADELAKKRIFNMSDRDIFMLGLGVYIGEGCKTYNITKVSNSDPKIIKFSSRWFKTCFGIKTEQIKVRLHLYPDNDIDKCTEYWSKMIDVPKNQFYKPSIDRRKNKKNSNRKKLPYGTAHMIVNSLGNKKDGVSLNRYLLALINRVLC